MTEPNQSVPRTKWWEIALSVLFIPCMLIWLWVYLRNAGHFSDLFLHHGLYCPLIPLPYYFMPVLGYPWLLQAITTLPYCLIWITLTMIIMKVMVKITVPGFIKNRWGKFIGALLLAGLLFRLLSLAIIWGLYNALFLLIIMGTLYLYLRPPMKDLAVGLVFAACFCYFFTFSVFYLNEALDGSPPSNMRGGKIIERYHLGRLLGSYVYGFGYCPFGRDKKGQLPRIEVHRVHRGFFGLKWQEYQQPYQGDYKLLPD